MELSFNIKLEKFIGDWVYNLIIKLGVSSETAINIKFIAMFSCLVVLFFLIDFIGRKVIVGYIGRIAKKTETKVDDILVEKKVFDRLSHIPAVMLVYVSAPVVFVDFSFAIPFVQTLASVAIVVVLMMIVNSFLNAIKSIFLEISSLKDKPINSYVQLAKIINFSVGFIFLISIIVGKSPIYLFSALGALTAVLLLVFKDTLLGFVASIQLATNDMVRIGDWVTLDKFGADGDIIEINLNTIKVRNWDKTITTIPTYAFISDSFKNWRGMVDSGGRRIKRSIRIKLSSVKFCTPDDLNKYKSIHLLTEYITKRQIEIDEYNAVNKIDTTVPVNGRKLTNIGIFRKYAENYLLKNPKLNRDFTIMVRQLEADANGLPIEIYCFSSDLAWVNYEAIQADIFDHLFAVAPHFDLEIFQNPSGGDFRSALTQAKA
jgi:miniconductance mechanosensitive channel